MKRHVMQPFRPPRQHKEKASPTRQSPRQQGKQPLIIKETQYTDVEEVIDNGVPDIDDRGKQYAIEARLERSPIVHSKHPPIVSTQTTPSCSDFEAWLESKSVSASASDVNGSDDDDNIPIAATLAAKKSNLSLLVDAATQVASSPPLRKKKTPKVSPPFTQNVIITQTITIIYTLTNDPPQLANA
jgi:hypothetical protein